MYSVCIFKSNRKSFLSRPLLIGGIRVDACARGSEAAAHALEQIVGRAHPNPNREGGIPMHRDARTAGLPPPGRGPSARDLPRHVSQVAAHRVARPRSRPGAGSGRPQRRSPRGGVTLPHSAQRLGRQRRHARHGSCSEIARAQDASCGSDDRSGSALDVRNNLLVVGHDDDGGVVLNLMSINVSWRRSDGRCFRGRQTPA